MLKHLLPIAVVCVLGLPQNIAAQEDIRFAVPEFPPYTFEKDNIIQGFGLDLVQKILNTARLKYSTRIVPNYGRAVLDVKNGHADGFFLATQNAERDEVAVMSKAIMQNRWCWFLRANSPRSPADADFKNTASIGTQLNTNTHIWLKDNGYRTAPVHEVTLLPKLLLTKKHVDAVFVSEYVFLDAVEREGIPASSYKKIVQQEQPFGLYLAKTYLANHPGTMERINAAITSVSNEPGVKK